MLERLTPSTSEAVMVGFETADDAAVYRLDDGTILLLTVDFFTPVVDDPYDFGRITAANALSDVYAMGGRPLVALNLLAWPCDLGPDAVGEMLRGGAEKVLEAGAVTVGGHTVDDEEPKYGLSVLGVVEPERLVRNAGARPGDALVLTKPIGTGVMTTAVKAGLETDGSIAEVIESMATLNRAAAEAMGETGAHAATDVTGFGLLGHLHEMALAGGLAAEVALDAVPVFERALEYSRRRIRPGRTAEVIAHLDTFVDWGSADEAWKGVLGDPQTSGGLLIALPEEDAPRLLDALAERGVEGRRVGAMVDGDAGTLRVR